MSAGERDRVALDAAVEAILSRITGGPAPAAPELPGRAPALDAITSAFRLSSFERSVLVLCAGAEVDGAVNDACAQKTGLQFPTFGLALGCLDDPHWSALTPVAPLRRWRLVTPEPGAPLTHARLRIDERVLHHMLGLSYLDPSVERLVEPVDDDPLLAAGHAAVAADVARAIGDAAGDWPRVELVGPHLIAARAVAARASSIAGRRLHRLHLSALAGGAAATDFIALWEREATLGGLALLVESDGAPEPGDGRGLVLRTLAERTQGVLMFASADPLGDVERSLRVEVGPSSTTERVALWRQVLGGRADELNGRIEAMAAHFELDAPAVRAAGEEASVKGPGALGDRLWAASRARARPRLDDLATRIRPAAGWDDLVLPPAARRALREIAGQVRRRERVYAEWGFGARSSRGLGITALFAGQSGTGKTMAAEVIAGALDLDLYAIDLSSVVSKYIGETEKNLRRVFDAAERGSAVLLFDEADALFGTRTEVKDSHDRFANIEVSYLLQRMEAYRGLAILTTNRREAIDEAFLRRLRFVVEFPFPDLEGREEIWCRVFPDATPLHDVDPAALAQLAVAGGNIRNIALGAAFLAADEDAAVSMDHLARAARSEYVKLRRPASSVEIGAVS
jgi:hypothetical protein